MLCLGLGNAVCTNSTGNGQDMFSAESPWKIKCKLVSFLAAKWRRKNPAKRRSALNLHLCIDYYIQNHLNTHHNTSRNTQLYTGLYWVGVRWAVTKCWWRLLASHGRLRLGWAVTIKPKYWVGVGWAVTKCWWRLLTSHGRLKWGWAVTIKGK